VAVVVALKASFRMVCCAVMVRPLIKSKQHAVDYEYIVFKESVSS
jgi:hypothetical protein